jgi:ElaB/YqjD/DUF883 family membrane-anchored ribosome-binding protein
MRTKTENGPDVDLERLVEDIKAVVHDGQQLLKHGVSGVKERALTSVKTTQRAVRENPYQTIGLVFAVGLVLGLVCYGAFSHAEPDQELE